MASGSKGQLAQFQKVAKDLYTVSKDFVKAETACRDGLKQFKGDSSLTFYLSASLAKSKDSAKWEEALKAMPTLAGTHQPVVDVFKVWCLLASNLNKWGELAEASSKAIDALKSQPPSPKVVMEISLFEANLKIAKEKLPSGATPKKAKSKGKEGDASAGAAPAPASASASATATAPAKSPLASSSSSSSSSSSVSTSDLLMGGGQGVDKKFEDPVAQREGVLSLWKSWMEDSFEPSFLLPRPWWDTWCAHVSLDWEVWEAQYHRDPSAATTTGEEGRDGEGEGEGEGDWEGEGEGGFLSSSLSRSSSARVQETGEGVEGVEGGGEGGKEEPSTTTSTTTPSPGAWILPPPSSTSSSSPRPPAIPTHLLVIPQPGVAMQGHASKCHQGLRLTQPPLLTPKEVIAVSSQIWGMLIPLYGCSGPSIERLQGEWYPELMTPEEQAQEESKREKARARQMMRKRRRKGGGGKGVGAAAEVAAAEAAAAAAAAAGSAAGSAGGTTAANPAIAPPLPAAAAAVKQFCCSVCGLGGAIRCQCKATFYCPKSPTTGEPSPCQSLAWKRGHNLECAQLRAVGDVRRRAEEAVGPNPSPTALAALPPRPKPTLALCSAQVGLTNLKNTCFMAASIQALASVWPLTRHYLRGEHEAQVNAGNPLGTGGSMARSYAALVGELWVGAPGSAVAPTGVLAEIRRFQDRFEGHAQHDAQEFLMFLVDGLHEDCNAGGGKFSGGGGAGVLRDMEVGEGDEAYGAAAMAHFAKLNDSLLCRLFYGTFKNTMRCPLCSARSLKFDPFNVLSLPIPPPEHFVIELVLFTLPSPTFLLHSPHAWALPSTSSPPEALALWNEVAENSIPPGCARAFSYRLLFPSSQGSVSAEEVVRRLSEEANIPPHCLVIHPFASPSAGRLSYGGVGAGGGGPVGTGAAAPPKPACFYPFLSPHTPIPLPYTGTLVASQVAPPDWVRPRAPGEAPLSAEDASPPPHFSAIAEEYAGALEAALKKCADAASAALEASENAEKATVAAAAAAAATTAASGGSGAAAAAAAAAAATVSPASATASAAGAAGAGGAKAGVVGAPPPTVVAAEAVNASMSPTSPKLGGGGGGGGKGRGEGGGGGTPKGLAKWVDVDDAPPHPPPLDPTSPSALAAAATAAASAAVAAVTAASTTFPATTAAPKAAYLGLRPPSHRLLVPMDFWVEPTAGEKTTQPVFGENPFKNLLPEKAFGVAPGSSDAYKPLFTLVLSLTADTPLPILRLHAAAYLLPLLGGLAVWRKRLVESEEAYKAGPGGGGGGGGSSQWGRFGEGIPPWQALVELAVRLPMTNGDTLLRKSKEALWMPSVVPTHSVSLEKCLEKCAGGAVTPGGAAATVGGELPPTLPPLGSPADATPPTLHALVTATLGACLLRGPALRRLLMPDQLVTRFLASNSYKASAAALESELDVSTLLRKFLSQESLDESNTWLCTGCGKRVSAEKTLELWDLPDYLVVNLKRYGTKLSKSGAFSSKKSEKRVNFPLMGWDVAPFLKGGIGNFKGGHYTAYVNKSARLEGRVTREDEWIKFDDHKVTSLDKKHVVTDDAYIMIFAKRK